MTNMCCLNNSIDMPYLSQTEKKKKLFDQNYLLKLWISNFVFIKCILTLFWLMFDASHDFSTSY